MLEIDEYHDTMVAQPNPQYFQSNNSKLVDSSQIGVLFDLVIRREVSTKFINLIHHTLG